MTMRSRQRTLRISGTSAIAILFSLGVISGSEPAGAAGMHHGPAGPVPVTTLIKDPKVPFRLGLGLQRVRKNCAACHGQWAEGVADKGPPLVHPYYRPDHHPDAAFYRAAMQGVKAHHWPFGDMPPVPGITSQDVTSILEFLRWWQEQNGMK